MRISHSDVVRAFVILFALTQFTVSAAHAQNSGGKKIYIGGGAGATKSDSASSLGVEDRGGGVSIYLGRRLGKQLAVEVNFTSFGEFANQDNSYIESFSALSGRLLGFLPIANSGLDLTGHVGYGLLSWEREFKNTVINGTVRDSGDTILAGVGLNYGMGQNNRLTLRLAYDYYYYATSNAYIGGESSSHSLEMFSFNVHMNFR